MNAEYTGPSQEQFGLFLERLREQADLTVPQLSERASIPVDRLVMIEGGYADPLLEEIEALAHALDMMPSVLFRRWEFSRN